MAGHLLLEREINHIQNPKYLTRGPPKSTNLYQDMGVPPMASHQLYAIYSAKRLPTVPLSEVILIVTAYLTP